MKYLLLILFPFLLLAQPTKRDLDLYKGDSHTISFDTDWDVSSDSLLFIVKADRGDDTPRVITRRNTTGGGSDEQIEVIYVTKSTILVKLTQINTEGLTPAIYVYDLTVDSTTTLYTGYLKLRDEVGGSADGIATVTPYYTVGVGIKLKNYGLAGDNSTDDVTLFRSAITDAKAAPHKTLIYYPDSFYVSDYLNRTGLKTVWNGAYIRSGYVGSEGAIRDSATITDYGDVDTLASDAEKGTFIIEVNTAAFIVNLKIGDLIKVISNKVVSGGIKTGEVCLVEKVAGAKIYINKPLFDSYYTSDDARLQLITKTTGVMVGPGTLETPYSENSQGIVFTGNYRPIIDNITVINARSAGVSFRDCYAPRFRGTTIKTDASGMGYGVHLIANKFADISGQFLWNHHGTTTGAQAYGIEWDALVHHSYSTPIFTASGYGYDTHAYTGSITFQNCIAEGGLLPADTSSYQGDWVAATVYDANDIVSKGGWFYTAQDTTSYNDPLTATNTSDWKGYRNGLKGFSMRAPKFSIIDCEVIGMEIGFSTAGTDLPVTDGLINNFNCENVRTGVAIKSGNVSKFRVDGVYVKNDFMTDGWLLQIDNVKEGLSLGTFVGYNMPLLKVFAPLTDGFYIHYLEGGYSRNYEDKMIEFNNDTTYTETQPIKFGTLKITGRSGDNMLAEFKYNDSDTILTPIIFNEVIIDTLLDSFIESTEHLANVQVNSIIVNSITSAEAIFELLGGVGILYVSGINKLDNTTFLVNVPAAKLFDKGYFNGYDKKGTSLFEDKIPTVEVLQGSMLFPNIIKITGTPENQIAAPIGTIAVDVDGGANTTLYIKESGTGDTGWAAM